MGDGGFLHDITVRIDGGIKARGVLTNRDSLKQSVPSFLDEVQAC